MSKVRVDSTRFADIEVDEDRVLFFPDGIIGFESFKRFALVAQGESALMWLQSLDEPSLAFVVADPLEYYRGYQPDFEEDVVKSLGASSSDELGFWAIAVIPPDPSRATLNLRAPIAVNKTKRLARQIVTTDPRFPIKYRMFSDQNRPRGEEGTSSGAGEGSSC